jgi:hypothetical protein
MLKRDEEMSSPSSLLKSFLSLIGLGEIKLPEKINIKMLNGNKKYEIDETHITINLNGLSEAENQAFSTYIGALRASKEEYLLMERKSYEVLNELYKLDPDFQAIEKLQNVLSPEDYGAVEGAVYIKYLKDKGRFAEISERKKQIRHDYGERGNTITNLYTAGYFHEIFLPLYDELLKEPGNMEEFRLIFDRLIRDFPLAIFINQQMNVDDVKNLIKNKITRNKRYGIMKLNIHGINKSNCDNIKEAIRLLEEEKELTFTKALDEISNIIMVKLEF